MSGPAQRAGRSSSRAAVPRRPFLLTRPGAARRAFALPHAGGVQQAALTLSKLGVRDRTRAVLRAFELQLI